jgi:hypothetical protein
VQAGQGSRTYAFKAFLDGQPIGEHTFTVVAEGDAYRVTSAADFRVKIMGFTAYRHRHRAEETWAGDCLTGLSSSTDDDGKAESVKLVAMAGANQITTHAGTASEPGCLMSYAYWNPAMRRQARLLNPQTGHVDAVTIERVAEGRVAVGATEVDASDWRITGGRSPIDVWISAQGEWVGLDSMVDKGRHQLTYRLP